MNININPFDIMKNAQKVQEQMSDLQGKLEGLRATGSAGGGMIEIDLNGKMEVVAVRITPEAVLDIEMLQDLVVAAFANGMEKIREAISGEIGSITGLNIPGIGIPGFPGMP